MKYFRSQLCRFFVAFFLREKYIFYVTGMRRSGNHTFVRWLSNALEEEKAELILSDSYFSHFLHSESEKIIFFDEVNELPWRAYLSTIWNNRKMLRRSEFIIISTEDCGADYNDWRIPDFDCAIYVRRKTLNVVASRIRKLENRAKKGSVLTGFNVDSRFFKKLRSWSNPPKKFHIWDYDKWSDSKDYRLEFLKSINLKFDLNPSLSIVGSSFSARREIPDKAEVLNRFKQIKISATITDQLKEYKDLLSDLEIEYLEKKYTFD